MINLIVCMAKNRAIGKDNKIPWYLPEDLARFKELTTPYPVIMGAATWKSLPKNVRPLPGRANFVLSYNRDDIVIPGDVYWSDNMEDAIETAQSISSEVFIIGGASIYRYALRHSLVDRMYVTEVQKHIEGDCFFPEIRVSDWSDVVCEGIGHYKELTYMFWKYQK